MKYFGYSKTKAQHNHHKRYNQKRKRKNYTFMDKRYKTSFRDLNDYMKNNSHSLKNMKPRINTRI